MAQKDQIRHPICKRNRAGVKETVEHVIIRCTVKNCPDENISDAYRGKHLTNCAKRNRTKCYSY